jgi:hypothetical protein
VELGGVADELVMGERFRALAGELKEGQRRLWAASEARAAGRGGIAATARATGMAVDTIRQGIAELEAGERLEAGRVRRRGDGRKRVMELDPTLVSDLERLVAEDCRGDPESLLLWTSRSVRSIARGLRERGHRVEYVTVAKLMRAIGYGLRANVRTREGAANPDRDAQFCYINEAARRAKGEPELVRVHDFKDKQLGKAIPCGVWDVAANRGWVTVGVDHDTARFAVNSIRSWWTHLGGPRYPRAGRLQICADCGGSNDNRVRPWKVELQKFADASALEIDVCHLPRDHEHRRVGGLRATRRRNLPRQDPGLRRRHGRRQPARPQLPPRVELHHQTATLFLNGPLV